MGNFGKIKCQNDDNNIFGLSKNTYPANKETSQAWDMAVKLSKLVPGKYGAITIKNSK